MVTPRVGEIQMVLSEITDSAVERVRSLLVKEGKAETHGLRIKVEKGGCSGQKYVFEFDDAEVADDTVLEVGGVSFYIDPESSSFLKGSTLDFIDTLLESGFKLTNPNASKTCSCGDSFKV